MLTNQNFIFFEMQWWYSVPKLKLPLQTHTWIYKETNKINLVLSQSVVNSAIHRVSYIQETTSNLLHSACIFMHTYTKHHLYVHTQ